MLRREVLATAGLVGASGCLRLTSSGNGTTDAATGEPSGDAGSSGDSGGDTGSGGGLFASRSEALRSVAAFVDSGDVTPVEPYSGPSADLIRFGSGWGSSYGSGENGGVVTASDLQVEPIDESGLQLGGNSDRRIRVRNLTLDATLTFDPDSDTAVAEGVTEISVDPTSEGDPPSELGLELDGGSERRRLGGTWSGDSDIFRRQAIGTYVVELIEGEETIGRTAGKSFGTNYRWGARQTTDALYVTRQPSVREAWVAELAIGGNTFDPQARASAEQLVDEDAFRIDLTDLDLEAGQYDWTLLLGTDRPARDSRILQLTPLSTSLIFE